MRKTKLDSMRTRQLLIDTAIQEFARRGVSSTTLTDIADAAHVTRGAIYWHFSSKAELFNEIWKQQVESKEEIAVNNMTEDDSDPLTTLRQKLITLLKTVATDPKYRALMEILYHKCEFTEDMITECEIKDITCFDRQSMAAALQRCIDSGQISATLNINVAIILLQSCLNGIISDWLSQPDSFNLFSLVDILVDNMLKMILAEPQQKQTEQSRRHRSVNQAYI
ncbi:TetR family transcriptional regulator [Atlantibacter hermannii]|uniref:TetR family transcriptional regulator n=1 Tax=Atlantibacter hermannii TaxID=565 RepID=UPI002DB88B1D|nr:TetR family transcriptional regulator [Atlantibacter hermannii]MEB7925733.1 TetR family transcriptional regulator [Atlantibacter hermannii]